VNGLVDALSALRASGRKALVVYLVGGLSDDWLDGLRAAAAAGADAIEVGIPFSDPLLDGVVIQAASDAALRRGTTFSSVLGELASLDVTVPRCAMTYYNLFHHRGLERAAGELARAGVSGAIIPDLPLEECGPWRVAADAAGVANVLMVAPSSPPERVAAIAAGSRGFVYAAARMAVTGAAEGPGDAARVVAAVRSCTDLPVYAGIGITTPAQAAEAAVVADGVIVGTAVVRRLLDGEGPRGVESVVGELRAALS
jgi:tryptophan synthase alpha chain